MLYVRGSKMKKILFSLLICFVFASVVYAGVSTNATNGTPQLTYSLTANPDTVDSINVGFSTNAVPSHNEEVKPHSGNQTLSVKAGEFVGTHTEEIHVYWKLYTDNDITLTLTPTAMDGDKDGNEDTLDVILTTKNDSDQNDLNGVTRSEISYDTAEGATGNTGLVILKYDSSATDNKEAAGSQTVIITTENIAGHTADTYKGTLTLTISTDPIGG